MRQQRIDCDASLRSLRCDRHGGMAKPKKAPRKETAAKKEMRIAAATAAQGCSSADAPYLEKPRRERQAPQPLKALKGGPLGGRIVAPGISAYTGRPPTTSKQVAVKDCSKTSGIYKQRLEFNRKGNSPTLSSRRVWDSKYECGVVSSKKKPKTLHLTYKAIASMAGKYANAVCNNLIEGRAAWDCLFDAFKIANESEVEPKCYSLEKFRPNSFHQSIDVGQWNRMMDEGDNALAVLQAKAQELHAERAAGPSPARALEMLREFQIVGVVNEVYGPTYQWPTYGGRWARPKLEKSRLVPSPSCRSKYLPAHEVTRENLDALIAWCHSNSAAD